ncbi:hypothetical protein AB0M43_01995 [Longispora sp. NPDC051575]|uniref:bpX5 domain-containing protein n=1 Tax=Longispora sp. NPDC051575 TaxID=3154943 RepID=UPI003417DAAD
MTVGLAWAPREPPLTPAAVVGFGPVASALADAAGRALAAGVRLRAAGHGSALLVLGEAEELPWVDGARYLGWDGPVLTPTTHRPLPSAALWRGAVSGDRSPADLVAVLPERILVTATPREIADLGLLATVTR